MTTRRADEGPSADRSTAPRQARKAHAGVASFRGASACVIGWVPYSGLRADWYGVIWKKVSSGLTMPSSERARSSTADVPCFRS
jgi:hypothetical protein